MSGQSAILSNGVVSVAFQVAAGAEPLFHRLRSFLAPVFASVDHGDPSFTLTLEPFDRLPPEFRRLAGQPFVIRRSSAALFNFSVEMAEWPEGRLAAIDEIGSTAYLIDRTNGRAVMYVSDRSFFHLIEFVRYTALICEEAAGTVLLHAAAVLSGDGAVLILGRKGAGKTTTMLRLVGGGGQRFLSGDKVLLSRRDGGYMVRAWPDYPHVGIGSLRQVPAVAACCGVSFLHPDGTPRPDTEKISIDPDLYLAALGGAAPPGTPLVSALIFPDVRGEPSACRLIRPEERRLSDIEVHIETTAHFTPGRWHGLVEEDAGRIRPADPLLIKPLLNVPWIKVTGDAHDGIASLMARS